MAPVRLARLLTSGLFLAGATGVLGLGVTLAAQGLGGGRGEAWLLAWGLLFAVLVPAAALVLMAVSMLAGRAPRSRTVPNPGRTVPRTGQ
ncbi:hypothetical protein [Lysobacter humi (ex Lee et al. 2017)]